MMVKEGDIRQIRINQDSNFLMGLKDLALDESVAKHLARFTDFDFDIDYKNWTISFSKEVLVREGRDKKVVRKRESNIKISRGEERIFIWCLFMAICERLIDGHDSYTWVKYIYVDDPISSLDDSNAIAVASDLAALLRKAASRTDADEAPDPLKVLFSSHHALFFNVMCNELKTKAKRYFLHRPDQEGNYSLRKTDDTPFFHHIAMLSELQRAYDSGALYTYHFNILRSIMEKTATFFGHKEISYCLEGLEDEDLYARALNLLSHGKYTFLEPAEMVADNKELFGRILTSFLERHRFHLPELVPKAALIGAK